MAYAWNNSTMAHVCRKKCRILASGPEALEHAQGNEGAGGFRFLHGFSMV